jgi:hypothetical protein
MRGESDEVTTTGDVIENPVTGERAVIRVGTVETAGAFGVIDLYIRPGGAVVGEHWHPAMDERFTVLRAVSISGSEGSSERPSLAVRSACLLASGTTGGMLVTRTPSFGSKSARLPASKP